MNVSGAGRHGWAPTNSANLHGGDGGVCVRVRARDFVCGACVPMPAHACVMCLQYKIIIFDPV